LIQLHAQCSKAIEDITNAPIAEGHAILDLVGRGTAGAEGVKRTVEELENRKISLDRLCVAHREENIRINKALNNFLEKHNEIYSWLVSVAEAFLQEHRNMGDDLPMAKDFLDLHNQLLNDLQTKGNEINALILTLPPILEYLEDNQRKDVDSKVEEMHERWINLKNVLENRLGLARIYVKFHMEADIVNREMDKLEADLLQNKDRVTDDVLRNLEEKWESLVPLYQSAKNTGLTFIDQANKVGLVSRKIQLRVKIKFKIC
jgi:titin